MAHVGIGSETQNKRTKKYNDKIKTISNADELLKSANNWIGEQRKHGRKDNIVEFGRGNVFFRVANDGYSADVIVGIKENGSAVLYDLKSIYETKITDIRDITKRNNNPLRTPNESVTKESVSLTSEKVKQKQFDLI